MLNVNNASRQVEDTVLRVYRKVSPSYRKMNTKTDFLKNYLMRRNILDELCLPEQSFDGKKVIDIGGGTGENSIFYALWGADVTILDPNEISLRRAVSLFRHFGKKLVVIEKGLFNVDARTLKTYDIVNCEGVLHHTYNPTLGLNLIASNIRKGAILMIAIAEYHGWFKRALQRELIHSIAGNDEQEIIKAAKRYFREHIDRAVKFGLRSEDSVIYDTYVNPQMKTIKLKEICRILLKKDIKYLSSYPKMDFFALTQPLSQPRENRFNYGFYKKYYQFLEKIWMCSGQQNTEKILKDFSTSSIIKRIKQESLFLYRLKDKVKKLQFKSKDLRVIQKGYLGIGTNYFVGVKE